MSRNSTLTIFTLMLSLSLSVPVFAQSHSPDLIDDRNELDQKTKSNSQTAEEMQKNPGLMNPISPSGEKIAPSSVNPSSPDGINPLNPSGIDQKSSTGGTGGSTGY